MVLRRGSCQAQRPGAIRRRVRVLGERRPRGARGRPELRGGLYGVRDQRRVLRELLERRSARRTGAGPRQHRREHRADRVLTVSRRPRLLFLCQTVPYPPDSGVAIRSYHVLRMLARRFDVTALCFYRRKGGAVSPDDLTQRLEALRSIAEVEAFPVPQEHSRWRLAWDHLRSVGRQRAHTTFAFDSAAVRARVTQLLRERRFALIHLDSLALSRYLPLVGAAPVVCVHHNVESLLLDRRAGVERNPWRRQYLGHQARLMEREERRWCRRCALNVVVSESDAVELGRIVPGVKSAVELTGYVPDVRPYVHDAACYVVPLRVGGGTRLKILDAWAMGKAVVSTSVGCEGLAAEDGRNILIRDDPESFAQAVRTVLRDAPLRLRLGVEGRRTVERQYSWERIGESLLSVY